MASDCDFGGIIKLYDGLYIAEQFGARDIESILMNHITHIINCTVDQIPNFFQQEDIQYLPYKFNQISPDAVLLDQTDRVISEVYNFIEEAREQGESVLIHGCKEYNIPLVFFTGYLMLKYRWSLGKSMQFIERRVGPLPIKGGVLNQLRSLEARFRNKIRGELSSQWQVFLTMSFEEQTIHNTYINALGLGKSKPSSSYQSKKVNKKKVTWRQGPSRAASSKPKRFKSILKVGGVPPENKQKQRSQKNSTSQSLIKQKEKQIKTNSSLDNKSFKLIKDRIEDKLRTTIQLFKTPKEEPRKCRLKSEPGEEEEKKVLVNIVNGQKPSKPSTGSEELGPKNGYQIKERLNTDENIDSSSDITRQIIKKIIFEKNNTFLFKDSAIKDKENQKERSKNSSQVGIARDSKLTKQSKFRPSINNFISDTRPYSKPQSPAQKSDKTQSNNVLLGRGKIDLKLKTQFRGFSPMLKQNTKKKEMQSIVSSKIFSDGPKRAWK